jgi:parvulin-like peptidyl-prolyl isomerase
MVEPFAKAAFAQTAFQIGEPVPTQFGYHLILVTKRNAGKPTKFEDALVKDAVKEVYEGRLREAVLDQMKPRAKIEIATPKN